MVHILAFVIKDVRNENKKISPDSARMQVLQWAILLKIMINYERYEKHS